MTVDQPPTPSSNLTSIIESARRLGVELDEAEALRWLTDMAASSTQEVTVDVQSGVFGHRVAMLDFNADRLTHFREIGRLVEFKDQPGKVETALALSGSAAQSKIQTYPGDCDFFERVNIKAATREQACRILAEIMREKALSTQKGPTYQLLEVKFGSYPFEAIRGERTIRVGTPISWVPEEIQNGK